jgi:hypothetical protein
MAPPKPDRSQLGELLVEMGLVERDQLNAALIQQRATGGRLARILSERRFVDEDRLAKAVSAKLGLEAVNLSSLKIHERVLSMIPSAIALKYGALPIAIKRTNQAEFVYVVMADPLDAEAIAELQRVSGRQIRVLVAAATDLDRALEIHYRGGSKATLVDQPIGPHLPFGKQMSSPGHHPPALQAQPRPEAPRRATVPPPSPQSSVPPPLHPQAKKPTHPPPAVPPPFPEAASRAGDARRVPPPASTSSLGLKSPAPPLPSSAARTPARPQPSRSSVDGPASDLGSRSGEAGPPLDASRSRPERVSRSSHDMRSERTPRPPPLGQDQLPPISRSDATLRPEEDHAPLPRSPSSSPGSAAHHSPPFPSKDPSPTDELRARPRLSISGQSSIPDKRGLSVRDRDHASDGHGMPGSRSPQPSLPREPIRVPSAEDDSTKIDQLRDHFPPLTSNEGRTRSNSGAQLSGGLSQRDWDVAMRDWERSSSDGFKIGEAALGLGAAAAPQMRDLEAEPVTNAASLDEIVANERALAMREGKARDAFQVDVIDPHDTGEELKTSQLDLSVQSGAVLGRSQPVSYDDRAIAGTLEVPIDMLDDRPSPFEGPSPAEVPTGLERTGIIPAIDWEREEFIPPPPSRPSATSGLAGSADIPLTPAAVRARSDGQIEPIERLRTPPPSVEDDERNEDKPRAEERPDTVLDEPPVAISPEAEIVKKRRSDPPSPAPEEVRSDLDPKTDPKQQLKTDDVGEASQVIDAQSDAIEPPADPADSIDESVFASERETLLPERRLDADESDNESVPVIEPSSLVSLIEDNRVPEDTGHDEMPFRRLVQEASTTTHADHGNGTARHEEFAVPSLRGPGLATAEEDPTNPRMEAKSVKAALDTGTTIERPGADPWSAEENRETEFGDRAPAPPSAPVSAVVSSSPDSTTGPIDLPADDAARLVRALADGDSLNSAERAQLVLAIGRLLIKRGIVKRDDLAEELRR